MGGGGVVGAGENLRKRKKKKRERKERGRERCLLFIHAIVKVS